MMNRNHVVVSRNWNNPNINIGISEDRISIDMTLESFLNAVTEEYGNPASTLTKAQHLARLTAATETVVTAMKHATVAVI